MHSTSFSVKEVFLLTQNKLNKRFKLGIVNLMPEMEATELQWEAFWENSRYSVELVWIHQTARPIRRTPKDHLFNKYEPIEAVPDLQLDALLLTGAPIERFEYEAVDYWQQITTLLDTCDHYHIPVIHICWGAMAGLFHRHQLDKKLYVEKLTGLFTYERAAVQQTLTSAGRVERAQSFLKHLPTELIAPQSRYAYLEVDQLKSHTDLTVLYERPDGEVHALYEGEKGHLYLLGHGEYEATTLASEYSRDLRKSVEAPKPQFYFSVEEAPPTTAYWQEAHTQLLDSWIQHHFDNKRLKSEDQKRIALLGFGTVGQGFVEVLKEWESRDHVTQRGRGCLRPNVIIESILVRQPESYQWLLEYYGLKDTVLVTDFQSILDSKPDLVVEVLTGASPAAEYIERLLQAGIPVVTANKAALSESQRWRSSGGIESGLLRYEAAVGGGIPLVQMVRESLKGVEIESFEGILNGTTNLMLTQLARGTKTYDEVLKEAQESGFAEADPTFDVEGYDSAYKLMILAELAYKRPFSLKDVSIEGITGLSELDFLKARADGGRIKLIASARKEGNHIELSVKPKLLDISNPLATTDGIENALRLQVKQIGKLHIAGPGAGGRPTGSAVLADVLHTLNL